MATETTFDHSGTGGGPSLTPHDHIPEEEKVVATQSANMVKAAKKAWEEAPINTKGMKSCPWCGFVGIYGNDGDEGPFKDHFLRDHKAALSLYWANPDLGFDAHAILADEEKSGEEWAPEGLTNIDQLDTNDYFYVPQAVKDKYLKAGGRFYWPTQSKAQYWIDRGYTVAHRPDSELEQGDTPTGARSGSESNLLTTNEHVLLYTPEANAQKLDNAKVRAMEEMTGNPSASLEDLEQRKRNASDPGDVGQQAYDHFTKNNPNMTHDNKMMLAKQAEKGYHEGRGPAGGPTKREPGERVYRHTR
jgi:hypothetical protein